MTYIWPDRCGHMHESEDPGAEFAYWHGEYAARTVGMGGAALGATTLILLPFGPLLAAAAFGLGAFGALRNAVRWAINREQWKKWAEGDDLTDEQAQMVAATTCSNCRTEATLNEYGYCAKCEAQMAAMVVAPTCDRCGQQRHVNRAGLCARCSRQVAETDRIEYRQEEQAAIGRLKRVIIRAGNPGDNNV